MGIKNIPIFWTILYMSIKLYNYAFSYSKLTRYQKYTN